MGSKDADSRKKKPAGLDATSLHQSRFFSQSLGLLSFSQKKENKQNVPHHQLGLLCISLTYNMEEEEHTAILIVLASIQWLKKR